MVLYRPSAELRRYAREIAVGCLIATAVPAASAIQLRVSEGRPFVDGVFVNGHGPYRFLVDTGTNTNLIETRLARKIGMNATFEDTIQSAVGTTSMPGSDGNVVELGPVRADGQRFQFSDLETLHTVWPDVRGVLGQWFLSGFDYRFDLHGKVLEFGKQETTGSRSQFRMLDGRLAVSTSLGDLVLDSGAARLVLFGIAPGLGATNDMLTFAGAKTVGTVARRLVIEGRNVWRGDAVAIPERTEPGVSGLMPLSFFRTIYVCNSEGYVVFE